jgi:hypothetical protein
LLNCFCARILTIILASVNQIFLNFIGWLMCPMPVAQVWTWSWDRAQIWKSILKFKLISIEKNYSKFNFSPHHMY